MKTKKKMAAKAMQCIVMDASSNAITGNMYRYKDDGIPLAFRSDFIGALVVRDPKSPPPAVF